MMLYGELEYNSSITRNAFEQVIMNIIEMVLEMLQILEVVTSSTVFSSGTQ